MDQELALEILLSGESALLTGPAGSGKTYILNQFVKEAKRVGRHVAITATTGLAATHLGGSTIHSWSGMGVYDELPKSFFDNLPKGRRETIENTDVLVIDEVSMLHDFRLDLVDHISRKVRKKDEPFGGIQVIFSGDFFQLPPVNRSGRSIGGSFIVNSAVWQEMHPTICYLTRQYRQNDEGFLDILNAMRAGDIRRHHAELLLSRTNTDVGEATELHTTNVNVDTINARHLKSLPGDEWVYSVFTTGSDNYVESLARSCLAQSELALKQGAFVMFVKNNPEKKYANGTLGKVVAFEENTHYPIVETRDGRRIIVGPETWELRDGDKKRASLTQIPLRLAWAITVHKSQGMTLDAARIDLSKAFVEGMGYVALSRVRNLDSLSLAGINRMALRVSPDALAINETLQSQSTAAATKFEHLRVNAQKRTRQKPPAGKEGTSWNEKIAKMRETYPNAYRPWSKADDKKLIDLCADRVPPLDDLAKRFGRHPGSIKKRLEKHFEGVQL